MSTAELTATQASENWSDIWWLVLLQGIASLIIGILLITDPGATLVTLVFFLGIYWFVSGIFDLVHVFLDKANWGWHLAGGVLGILAGLLIIRHPLWSSVIVPDTVVLLVGLIGIVMGIMGIIQAFRGKGWGTGIVGLISIVFGALLLAASPLAATFIVVVATASFAIVAGIFAIVMAFRLRRA